MPRDGETPLARFAHAITQEQGFSFGTPRLSDDGFAVVLPVLRTALRLRGYVLPSEVSDAVSAVDVGRIDRLRIRNDARVRVFLPPGTLFHGDETASRALCVGACIDPGSVSRVEVKCVHAARAIKDGAELRLGSKLAPLSATQALLSRDQGLTWSITAAVLAESGDLAEAVADWPAIGAEQGEHECGAFFLDSDGVISAEIFDSADSFRVAYRAIPPRSPPGAKLALNPSGAARIARDFLGQLARLVFRPATPDAWIAADASAAYAAIEGQVVHLIAFGRDLARQAFSKPHANALVVPPLRAPDDAWPSFAGTSATEAGSDDGDVAVAAVADAEAVDILELPSPGTRPRRRKVLTSGWDPLTFEALERYSRKEFGGDRSAALRFLARGGLSRRGYLGPRSPPSPTTPSPRQEGGLQFTDIGQDFREARVHDFERVAQTRSYSAWLRKRARLELERLADAAPEERLRVAAQSALERLGPPAALEPVSEPEAPHEPEAPPAPPPVDVTPLLRRAVMASARGQFAEALALFDEALEAEPVNLTALLGRAVTLRRAGKPQEALAGLDLVLRLEPDNAAAHLNRGRILQERGDLRAALAAFDRLAAVAPNDWDVWMARGDVLARMGRSEEALRSFTEALRRNPDDEKLRRRVETLERVRASSVASSRVVLPAGLEEGQSYLVKGPTSESGYGPFKALAGQKLPTLLITRRVPDPTCKDPGLAGVRIVRLQHGPGADVCSPAALASLSRLIERFVEEHHGRGAILLDGLEALIASNTFRDALLFVEHVNELVVQRRVIFFLLVPGSLPDREAALLERNLKVLT